MSTITNQNTGRQSICQMGDNYYGTVADEILADPEDKAFLMDPKKTEAEKIGFIVRARNVVLSEAKDIFTAIVAKTLLGGI
jgi:hypothetical protein